MARSGVRKGPVLVLGMHRSGTSAVAAGLKHVGLFMGSSLAQGDEWNPKGYFEERRIVAFNDSLLEMGGSRWDGPLPPGAAQTARWISRVAPAARLLEEIYGTAADWGFKDPRMCVLSSFWRQVFASIRLTPRLLLVLRDPVEVARSLARRDGISNERAGWLWLTHLMGSLDYVQADTRSRMVDFQQVLDTPAQILGDLAHWLELPHDEAAIRQYASDFIGPPLSHRADAGAVDMPALALRAYEYWRAVATESGFSFSSLQAGAWLDIRNEFERDVRPRLAVVQDFFAGDGQAALRDARMKALSAGLARAESLAMDRLDQIAALQGRLAALSAIQDTRMRALSEGLAHAESLALERLDKNAAMEGQLKELAEAFALAEGLALQRQDELERLDAQLKQTAHALTQAEKLAFDRLAILEKNQVG